MTKTNLTIKVLAGALLLLFFSRCTQEKSTPSAEYYKPWESLGVLFHEVQMAGIFPDSKTFVDCTPKRDPKGILSDYLVQKDEKGFDLDAFVKANFDLPAAPPVIEIPDSLRFQDHLHYLWDYLVRPAGKANEFSTLIPLPNEYVVPGGRFREIYYWDSYFTMVGLAESGREDLIKLMVDNFAFLIDTIGFIPNGNRTYYLGRSQPPYFSSMVRLYMKFTSDSAGLEYLPAIRKEYDFWMDGADSLTAENPSNRRVVRLPDGTVLNRYWDDLDIPRPESYKPDVELAERMDSDSAKAVLYRHLRAAAESGWDFSTRWFRDKKDFATIATTDILPVDLNCLLYAAEANLVRLYELSGEQSLAEEFAAKARARREAINRIFWSDSLGTFTDYFWTEGSLSDQATLAGTYPLYFMISDSTKAARHSETIQTSFLMPGGLATTSIQSGQQWDYPNGWAPLQWLAVKGLENYNQGELATEISRRWVRTNQKVFLSTGKMMEKYNVLDTTLVAGGGEYPTQDGFGWTNGVVLGLMANDKDFERLGQ